MATIAPNPQLQHPADSDEGAITRFIDRWIFVLVAAFLMLVVLVGFIPDSVEKIAAVERGERPGFPLVMHVHAVLMGAWMLLLLTQTVLLATRRKGMDMQLGLAGMILAPALVIAGIILVPTNLRV